MRHGKWERCDSPIDIDIAASHEDLRVFYAESNVCELSIDANKFEPMKIEPSPLFSA